MASSQREPESRKKANSSDWSMVLFPAAREKETVKLKLKQGTFLYISCSRLKLRARKLT